MRPVRWLGDSKKRISAFPASVRRVLGQALFDVQAGETPAIAKPLTGIGSGVFELRDDYDTDTYRVVYAIKLVHAVYVLHAFQKKSKSGRGMAQEVVEALVARLKRARAFDARGES